MDTEPVLPMPHSSPLPSPPGSTDSTANQKAALPAATVFACVLGNALEFYDFTTYTFFAVAIGRSFFPAHDPVVSLLISVATFGVGFCTRPLGGLVIGAFADHAGRKPAMMLTIALMAVGMLMLALTPPFAVIGYAAPVIVVAARLLQGFALGGEVGPATSYLIEVAPDDRRARLASWQIASQGCALLAAGIVGFTLAHALSSEAMTEWGWRVALLLGLTIIPGGLYIRQRLPESAQISDRTHRQSAARVLTNLLSGHPWPLFLGLIAIMTSTISTYVGLYMTTYGETALKLKAPSAITAPLIGGLTTIIFALLGGWLADRYGRKIVMLVPRIVLILAIYPAFVFLIGHPSIWTLLITTGLMSALGSLSSAAAIVAIPELLPTSVRASGLSTAYAFAVTVFGGTTQFVLAWLIGVSGDPLSPAWYMIGSGILGVIAMALMPETKGRPLPQD
ncbi:MFS transporter [Acidisoma cellulosilytica]|uniref:MFS transporter n=1 Tax=Acidisoma cellulosilyticum TaxID=2802395 RepID=A0A963YZL7_9PROT|nr:MFS transporter [Acidisoma cellulosilyticum]MCB8879282.1 MFS transporter [Acidisoma cellulosilyticum]